MDKDLEALIRISRQVGSDPDLVQGGGGNTSIKTADGRMYVKASGTALKDMREGLGYRLVDVARCLVILEDPELAAMPPMERERETSRRMLAACLDELPGRPSVETTLHAQLGRCVVHTHPSVVNGLLTAVEGRRAMEELFGDIQPPPLWIEYADFGYPLAARMKEALSHYRSEHGTLPLVSFLENHGLFVSAGEPEEAVQWTRRVFERVRRARDERLRRVRERRVPTFERGQEKELIGHICATLRRLYREVFGAPVLARFSVGAPVRTFLAHPRAHELAAAGPVVPDQVVYCNGAPLWVEAPPSAEAVAGMLERVVRANERGPQTPACVVVDGVGLFAVGTSPRLLESALSMMEAVLEMLVTAECFGGVRPLSARALKYIDDSEVESYRRGLAAGKRRDSPLAGQVAVVTGAGSGLGRGISIGLARKGMHVVLADIDEEGARETRRRIEQQGATGSGWPMKADVTSEQSVKGLLEFVVAHLGGVDVLVNAAGIAPAHPLVEFPLEHWRRALEVNLTGYFLAARETARVMIRQGTGGNIINLSSKSGLEPSRNNSAYNATKAGEIHLARGWALELAPHRIRVNCVCPGNVFRESKIWNEDYIRAAAEKRGIKPEEVIPYYVNLTALKVEIDWDDIAEAVAFLVSPAASKITGQTLVVDAGQVFVR